MNLFAHDLVFSRDLPPPKPSIYNLDAGSSLSLLSFGGSVEIPAVLTPSGAMNAGGSMSSSNLPRLTMAEINTKFQDPPTQEFIDRLDMVCYSAVVHPPPANLSSDTGPREMRSRTT